jgi:isoquinoline 1-oxidoreductase beta subunit
VAKDTPTADVAPMLQRKRKFPVSRRAFIIGGAATVGLAIGYVVWPRSYPLNLPLREDERLINGWVKIGTDGRVVVIVPQAEMGQGVYTALPQVLADELGAAWQSVSVEPAPWHPLYANTGVLGEVVGDLPPQLQGIATWAGSEVIKRMNLHLTGGSTSVRGYAQKMREAGAVARALLCKAAAREWKVEWTECTTQGGQVIHGDKTLSFAELAAKAADETPPSDLVFRPAAERTLVGRSIPRLDVPSKVDGTAQFGSDIRLPKMAYAAIVAAPFAVTGGVTIDRKQPKLGEGVFGVIDRPGWVAVVADRYWLAKQTIDALDVKITARFSDDVESDWLDRRILAELRAKPGHIYELDGSFEGKFGDPKAVTAATYEVPYLAHACLEPMTATARVNDDGTVEIWAPTQSITLVAWRVAAALGIEARMVKVYPTLLGGGFGRKAEADACVQAAEIAKEARRPVQLIWSREEDFAQDKYRPAAAARMRATVGADGLIDAWDCKLVGQSVTGSFGGRNMPDQARSEPDHSSVQGAVDLPYALPNRHVAHVLMNLPVPVGYWRAVGHSYTGFFIESFIDEVAVAANQDPLAFRLKHLAQSPRHAAVLKRAADRAGPAPAGRGRGYAMHESFGSIAAIAMDVALEPGGQIAVRSVVCAIDCGPVVHPDIVVAQMESGVIDGLSAALYGRVDFKGGLPVQRNFDAYKLMSLAESPEIVVDLVASEGPMGGVGEVGLPPAAAALTNAIFNLTGTRVRKLPVQGQALALGTAEQPQRDASYLLEPAGAAPGAPAPEGAEALAP